MTIVMTIHAITKQVLPKLASLLAASFGNGFELQDELDYFDKVPHDSWFYLSNEGTPQGFIRYFDIGNDVFKLEWYAAPSAHQAEVSVRLLEHFCQHYQLNPQAHLRIDVSCDQTHIINLLNEAFPVRKIKQMLYMSKNLTNADTSSNPHLNNSSPDEFQCDTAKVMPQAQLAHIANILSCLKPYSQSALEGLYEDDKLYVRHLNDIPVAALHLEVAPKGECEIITLATHSDCLRQGHASALLSAVLRLVASHYKTVYLRVDEANTGALELYKKLRLKIQSERTQQWWYVPVQQLSDVSVSSTFKEGCLG